MEVPGELVCEPPEAVVGVVCCCCFPPGKNMGFFLVGGFSNMFWLFFTPKLGGNDPILTTYRIFFKWVGETTTN